MNLENIRYYTSVILLVFACSALPSGLITRAIVMIFNIEENFRPIFFTIYTVMVIWGLQFYPPKMRGIL
ncbi:hypothetical protein PspS04_07345 [Pseudomonas sp. S04]|nr:hypothetical protein PspS04_07345 [Pseudomonas sp. S04]QHF32680.1 hypothetical protein PspS19_07345 [Pseudomonas sp. S19]